MYNKQEDQKKLEFKQFNHKNFLDIIGHNKTWKVYFKSVQEFWYQINLGLDINCN